MQSEALQSNKNGRYLSNLFEDTHDKMFQATSPNREAYWYNVKAIAEDVAGKMDATVRSYAADPNGLPLVVCYGMGVDSTAVLVEFERRGIRPDLILFAETGSEADHTYAFKPIMDAWLESVGFPPITVVQYQPKDYKHWPPYYSLEENCLTNTTLPSLAYGFKSCSQKWKIAPQEKFCNEWDVAQAAWGVGMKIRKVIGYDNGKNDIRRRNHLGSQDDPKYDYWYPLQEWGWDRERCKEEIANSSLGVVPEKSSCYFCPAMKPHELHKLTKDKLRRIVMIEARPHQRHIDHADEKRAKVRAEIAELEERYRVASTESVPQPSAGEIAKELVAAEKKLKKMGADGTPLIGGLWRKAVKGMRGATPHPASMTEYIKSAGLLPPDEVDRLKELIPSTPITKDDIPSWQEWMNHNMNCAQGCENCIMK